MMHETGGGDSRVPFGLRWLDLISAGAKEKLDIYRSILSGLGDDTSGADPAVVQIFRGASTVLRETKNLEMLIEAIGKLA